LWFIRTRIVEQKKTHNGKKIFFPLNEKKNSLRESTMFEDENEMKKDVTKSGRLRLWL